MTESFDEYGEMLRRALHADADKVMPAGDGLERIRTRIADRPAGGRWGWLSVSWTRPLIIAGAATAVAVVAVSAPPAIKGITTTLSGDQNQTPHPSPSPPAGHQAEPGRSLPALPGTGPTQGGSVPPQQVSPTPSGGTACAAAPGGKATDRRTTTAKASRTPSVSPYLKGGEPCPSTTPTPAAQASGTPTPDPSASSQPSTAAPSAGADQAGS